MRIWNIETSMVLLCEIVAKSDLQYNYYWVVFYVASIV